MTSAVKEVTTNIRQSGRGSGLRKPGSRKTYTLPIAGVLTANHTVIPHADISEKTAKHPLNPRCNESLSEFTVRDLIDLIRERGVDTDAVGVLGEDGKIYLVDGSRRRYCAILTQKDLPLWLLPHDLDPRDILAIIDSSRRQKAFSRREEGLPLLDIIKKENFTNLDDLADFLGMGRETCRRKVAAAKIDSKLIAVFPDPQAIPQAFYGRLTKLVNNVRLNGQDLHAFIDSLDLSAVSANLELSAQHNKIMSHMESHFPDSKADKEWQSLWDKKYKGSRRYVKVHKTADGSKFKLVMSQLSQDVYDDVLSFIKTRIEKNEA